MHDDSDDPSSRKVQFAIVRKAPLPFSLAVLAASVPMWGAFHWAYSSQLESKQGQIDFLEKKKDCTVDPTIAKCETPKWDTRLERVFSHHYLNESVVVDGKLFDRCTFTNVTFVHKGTGRFAFAPENQFGGTIAVTTDVPSLASMSALHELVRQRYPTGRVRFGSRNPLTGEIFDESAGFEMTNELPQSKVD